MLKKFVLKIIVISFIFSACGAQVSESEVDFLKINNEVITESEFNVYLQEAIRSFEEIGGSDIWETDFDGQEAYYVAVESGYNALITVKVVSQEADELGYKLSQENIDEAYLDAENYLKLQGNNLDEISVEKIQEVMEDRMIYNLFRDSIFDSYKINPEDYALYKNSAYEDVTNSLLKIETKTIVLENQEVATEVYEKLKQGENFQEIFNEFNVGEVGLEEIEIKSLDNFSKAVQNQIQEGYVSVPYENNQQWEIFYVVQVIDAPEEEKEELIQKSYVSTKAEETFQNQVEVWRNSVVIEINNENWNNHVETEKKELFTNE